MMETEVNISNGENNFFIEKEINVTESVGNGGTDSYAVSMIIVGGTVLLCIVSTIAFLLVLRRRRLSLSLQENILTPYSELELSLLPKFNIPSTSLKISTGEILGSGEYGIVFKGRVKGLLGDFAIKVANCPENVKNLLCEIKILMKVSKHCNVVSLIATCTEDVLQGKAMFVLDLCEKGSLFELLKEIRHSNDKSSQHYKRFLRWSVEIATGMEHISTKNVIHGDLAARNVLISGNDVAKITDFGLSRHLYHYQSYIKKTPEPMPIRWMAIESIKSGLFSTRSDVWSYGITLWEIFSFASTPYRDIPLEIPAMFRFLNNGERLAKPELATNKIFEVMSNCWAADSSERPSFRELIEEIGNQIVLVEPGNILQIAPNHQSERAQTLGNNIPFSAIKMDFSKRLNSGYFGNMYKATLKGREGEYAIFCATTDHIRIKLCLTEMKALGRIGKHPNVVSLLGACCENILQGQLFLVLEYCEKGNLRELLDDLHYSDYNVDLETRLLKWCYEIANGMACVSSKNIIHGNLSARSVLISGNDTVKISEFKLSRHLYNYDMMHCKRDDGDFRPLEWMAIESLKSGLFSTKSDVWSYGVTLWEIFSFAAKPFQDQVDLEEYLQQGFRLLKPDAATIKNFEIMESCWNICPELRPSFDQLLLVFGAQLKHQDYFRVQSLNYINING